MTAETTFAAVVLLLQWLNQQPPALALSLATLGLAVYGLPMLCSLP